MVFCDFYTFYNYFPNAFFLSSIERSEAMCEAKQLVMSQWQSRSFHRRSAVRGPDAKMRLEEWMMGWNMLEDFKMV